MVVPPTEVTYGQEAGKIGRKRVVFLPVTTFSKARRQGASDSSVRDSGLDLGLG